jgi:superfamily II DNA helicase RecQ
VDLANTEIFGNSNFRENQREIINATKDKKDVLALIPTGGGKSLTFQLSAITDPGVTFVVMPLLSLIEDNLNFVLDLSIPAISLSVGNQAKEEKKMGHLYQEIRAI